MNANDLYVCVCVCEGECADKMARRSEKLAHELQNSHFGWRVTNAHERNAYICS